MMYYFIEKECTKVTNQPLKVYANLHIERRQQDQEKVVNVINGIKKELNAIVLADVPLQFDLDNTADQSRLDLLAKDTAISCNGARFSEETPTGLIKRFLSEARKERSNFMAVDNGFMLFEDSLGFLKRLDRQCPEPGKHMFGGILSKSEKKAIVDAKKMDIECLNFEKIDEYRKMTTRTSRRQIAELISNNSTPVCVWVKGNFDGTPSLREQRDLFSLIYGPNSVYEPNQMCPREPPTTHAVCIHPDHGFNDSCEQEDTPICVVPDLRCLSPNLSLEIEIRQTLVRLNSVLVPDHEQKIDLSHFKKIFLLPSHEDFPANLVLVVRPVAHRNTNVLVLSDKTKHPLKIDVNLRVPKSLAKTLGGVFMKKLVNGYRVNLVADIIAALVGEKVMHPVFRPLLYTQGDQKGLLWISDIGFVSIYRTQAIYIGFKEVVSVNYSETSYSFDIEIERKKKNGSFSRHNFRAIDKEIYADLKKILAEKRRITDNLNELGNEAGESGQKDSAKRLKKQPATNKKAKMDAPGPSRGTSNDD